MARQGHLCHLGAREAGAACVWKKVVLTQAPGAQRGDRRALWTCSASPGAAFHYYDSSCEEGANGGGGGGVEQAVDQKP